MTDVATLNLVQDSLLRRMRLRHMGEIELASRRPGRHDVVTPGPRSPNGPRP